MIQAQINPKHNKNDKSVKTNIVNVVKEYFGDRELKTFRKGETIIGQDSPSTIAFLITKGTAKIVTDYTSENPAIISFCKKFDFIGLSSTISRRQHNTSGIAMEPTEGYYTTADDLQKITSHSNISNQLIATIAQENLILQKRVHSLTSKNCKERFVNIAKMLIETYGITTTGRLNFKISIRELAEFTCVSRETIYRVLKDLETENILFVKQKYLYIIDTNLRSFALPSLLKTGNDTGTHWIDDRGFLYNNFHSDSLENELTEDIAQEHIKFITTLCNNQPIAFLNDGRNVIGNMNYKAVMALAKSKELTKIRKAEAFLVNSTGIRLLINFYIKVGKPGCPTRVFKKKEEAIQWLSQYK